MFRERNGSHPRHPVRNQQVRNGVWIGCNDSIKKGLVSEKATSNVMRKCSSLYLNLPVRGVGWGAKEEEGRGEGGMSKHSVCD